MAENLMVGSHKSTNKKYREGYDRTFKRERIVTNYCTAEDHEELHKNGHSPCPRCGEPTYPRIGRRDYTEE
jgi:hypothetical protein